MTAAHRAAVVIAADRLAGRAPAPSVAEAVRDVVVHVVVPRLLRRRAGLQVGQVFVPARVMRGHARGAAR